MKQNDLGGLFTNPLIMNAISQFNPQQGQRLQDLALQQRQYQDSQRQQQEFELKQQEAIRQQTLAKSLPQALQGIDFSDPNTAYQQLVQVGLKPQEALPIIAQFANINAGKEQSELNKQRFGLEEKGFGLKEKELGLKERALQAKISGESNKLGQPRKLSAAEIRINKTNLDKLNSSAKASSEQLKQLAGLEKAYEIFDKEAKGKIGAGSFASNWLPQSDESEGFGKKFKQGLENTLYSDKARNALHTIKKVNSLLLQNRINAQKGNGPITDILKKEIKQGLPNPEILPEARRENIQSLKREAFKNILEQQFFSTWSKLNGRDTDETGAAFTQFIENFPIVDDKGNPNKDILKMIPQFVSEFLRSTGQDNEPTDQGLEQYFNFED